MPFVTLVSAARKYSYPLIETEKDIILEVRDEGVGIPQEDIRRVFEPFYTGKTVVHSENLLVWDFIS